jgi:hypothetical protein
MHNTARCLGYPSDSTRVARERAREATCGYHLRWTGQAQPGWATPSLVVAASPSPPRLSSSPVWLNPSPTAPLWLNSSPVWLALLSHLAGVGQCSLLTSHWPWGSSRAARRRAGSPARIATAVYVGA